MLSQGTVVDIVSNEETIMGNILTFNGEQVIESFARNYLVCSDNFNWYEPHPYSEYNGYLLLQYKEIQSTEYSSGNG